MFKKVQFLKVKLCEPQRLVILLKDLNSRADNELTDRTLA
jgi:hypothetical protein